jgi:flagellar basal body-associated protein FliL
MSDKPDKKAEPAAKDAAKKGDAHAEKKPGGGGLLTKLPVLLGGVMLIEAVVLFAGFKFLGTSAHMVQGAEIVGDDHSKGDKDGKPDDGATGDAQKTTEVKVVDFRAPNKQSGRMFIYDVSVFAVVKASAADRVKQTITDQEALIEDRIRTIIAQSDPDKLGGGSEPGLETLRRQIKFQLDQIVGDGSIDEVLVPRCMPFRADY